MTRIPNPIPFFSDLDGYALDNGFIYVGVGGMNAQTNPVAAYWDEALTIPASQPLRTIDGYPSYQGTPSAFFTGADSFSITVQDKNGVAIFTNVNMTDEIAGLLSDLAGNSGAGLIGFSRASSYSYNTVGKLLQDVPLSMKADFQATGDGVANDSTPVANAVAAVNALTRGGSLDLGLGIYLTENSNTLTKSASIVGVNQQTSILRFGTSANLIFSGGNKDEFTGKTFLMEKVGIETIGMNTGSVVSINFNASGTTLLPGFTARDCRIAGSSTSSGFDTAITIDNPSFPTLDNFHILGDRGGSNLSEKGVFITGDGGSAVLNRFRVYYVWDCITDDGNMEGNQYFELELVANQHGVTVEAEAGTFQPLRQIINSHINSEEYCISFTGITEFLITGCDLYGQGLLGTATQWTGINIDPGTYASPWTQSGTISDVTFQGDGAFAATLVGININGNANAAENIKISGCYFQSLDYGIYLGANTNGVWVTSDNAFNNTVTNIFNAGNNFIQAGGYAYTVATLPTGFPSSFYGQEVNVSDLTANTFGIAPTGGGAIFGKVRLTAAGWIIA